MKKLVSKFNAIPFEALAARRTTRDFCYSVERLPYGNSYVKFNLLNLLNYILIIRYEGHYAAGEYINEEALNYLQLMLNDMYFEYCVLMFSKTWPMKTAYDLLVLHVAESGIQKYWELQVKWLK